MEANVILWFKSFYNLISQNSLKFIASNPFDAGGYVSSVPVNQSERLKPSSNSPRSNKNRDHLDSATHQDNHENFNNKILDRDSNNNNNSINQNETSTSSRTNQINRSKLSIISEFDENRSIISNDSFVTVTETIMMRPSLTNVNSSIDIEIDRGPSSIPTFDNLGVQSNPIVCDKKSNQIGNLPLPMILQQSVNAKPSSRLIQSPSLRSQSKRLKEQKSILAMIESYRESFPKKFDPFVFDKIIEISINPFVRIETKRFTIFGLRNVHETNNDAFLRSIETTERHLLDCIVELRDLRCNVDCTLRLENHGGNV
ncbi:hypothetical protein SSS_04446 [Sarcoptes scabiei]|uniref:Uncharacterized protein n=1 Tax=Sarcoptes scabiei TaxID=52283 RepID=A0A834R5F3_SARSC|nr:hypothetical protein SSS_04446 [Sarcoptes scabiei]